MGRWERRLYRVFNAGVRLLLRSPMHGLASGKIMVLTITGRRSGRTFAIPLGYVRYRGEILAFTSGRWCAWWKNLGDGAPVVARVRGRRLVVSARAETGGEAVVERLGAFLTKFPSTARRYGVRLGADGRPYAKDLEAAVGEGRAVMVSLEVPARA